MIVDRYIDNASDIIRSDYAGAIQLGFIKAKQINIAEWRKIKRRYWQDDF